ncbi:solute carrier organic anion transporter family member 2A1-like [Argonauta hians]
MNEEYESEDMKMISESSTNKPFPLDCTSEKPDSIQQETLLSDPNGLSNTNSAIANIVESNENDIDYSEIDPDFLCGIGNFHPNYLQYFGNIYCFIIFYAGPSLFTSTLLSYIVSQITALERQFGFSSTNSGFLLACNDIGFLSTVIFASHFLRNKHIPRVLAAGTFIFGISGLLCASPFFLSYFKPANENLETQSTNTDNQNFTEVLFMCTEQKDVKVEEKSSPTNVLALVLISVGMMIQGMGKSVRAPLVTQYVDNNVKRTKTGKFMGIITAIGIFGPAVSYSVATLFSRMHYTLTDVNLSPEDPRWVGAWWLGFLSFGAAAIISCIPLLFFPKRLPSKRNGNTKMIEMEEIPENKTDNQNKINDGGKSYMKFMKDFLRSFKRICRKKSYVFFVCAVSLNIMAVAGVSSFGAKYIETQYHLPAWKSNAVLGATNLFALSGGTLAGGLITSKAKMSARGSLYFTTVSYLGVALLGSLNLLTGCDSIAMVGPDKISNRATFPNGTLIPHCGESCSCDETKYLPICSESGINYFSPCYAGCHTKNETTYSNCTCMYDATIASSSTCDTDCNIIYHAIIISLKYFFGTMKIIPFYISIIRIAGDEDKSLALGISGFCIACLGWMAGPVFFGAIIDTTCLIWSSTEKGGSGSCVLYDTDKMRNVIFLTEAGLTCMASVMSLFSLISHLQSLKKKKKEASKKIVKAEVE